MIHLIVNMIHFISKRILFFLFQSVIFYQIHSQPFKCSICGKGMTQKSGYKKHLLTHTGEKPHSCDICNREFRYSSNLIMHKRSHKGQKDFECLVCFTYAIKLKFALVIVDDSFI